jgi:FtsH-binding integral membrane protein
MNKYIYLFAGGLAFAGFCMQMFAIPYAYVVFFVGTISMLFFRYKTTTESQDFRIRRLQRIQTLALCFLVAATYPMYINHNAYVVMVMIYAVIELFVLFRWPSNK